MKPSNIEFGGFIVLDEKDRQNSKDVDPNLAIKTADAIAKAIDSESLYLKEFALTDAANKQVWIEKYFKPKTED